MKTTLFAIAGLAVGGWSHFAADADLKTTVSAAAKKLAGQSSFSWRTRVQTQGGGPFAGGGGNTAGRLEKDGYIWVSLPSADESLEFAQKGTIATVLFEGNWMTLRQAASRPAGDGGGPFGPGTFDPGSVAGFKV